MLKTSAGRRSAIAAAAIGVISSGQAFAASSTWSDAPTDSTWATSTNWVGGVVPGITAPSGNNVSNTDVVTFNAAIPLSAIGSASNPIQWEDTRFIRSIVFDTANVGSYYLGSTSNTNRLYLWNAGSITMNAAATNAQYINGTIQVRQASSTNGTYSFVNNSTTSSATLNFGATAFTLTSANGRPTTLTLDGTNTGNNTISSNITDAGGAQAIALINKTGAGRWVLSGTNTFTGTANTGIQINGGTLVAAGNDSLGTASGVTANATAINNGGTLEVASGLNLNGGITVNLNNGGTLSGKGTTAIASTLRVSTAAATSTTIQTNSAADVLTLGDTSNDLTGGASDSVLNIGGPGTVVLTQASNYAGSVSVNNGTLRLGNATALGSGTGSLNFGAGSTGVVQLNGNSISVGGLNSNATPGSPAIENASGGVSTLTVNNGSANTYAGVIRDGAAGQVALTKGGNGTLTLTGANTFTGNVSVTAGTLLANNSSGSATGVNNTLTASGNATVGGSGTIGSDVVLTPNARLAPGTGGVGSLHVKSLTLGASTNLDYDITSTASLDQAFVDQSGGLTINGGQLNINGGTGVFTTNGVYNLIGYTGSIGGTGVSALTLNALNKNTATNNYTFGTAGGFVTLSVTNSGGVISYWNTDSSSTWATGPWTTAEPNAAGAFASFGGGGTPITAARTVTVSGNKTVGTIAFNSANSFTVTGGSITLDNGVNPAFITDSAGSHTVNSDIAIAAAGNTVTVTGSSDTLTLGGVVSGSGAISKVGTGTLVLSGNNTYTGGTVLSAGTIAINSGTSLGDASGTLDFAGGSLKLLADATSTRSYIANTNDSNVTIDTNGHTLTHTGNVVQGGIGAGGIVKNGAGTLVLGGTNSYTGQTVVNGGTVSVSSNANLGAPATGAAIALGANTTLASTATFALDNAGANARNITVNATGATVDVADTTTLTIGGVVSGGPLTKSNTGTLVLTNTANTAALNVNAGTLTAGGTAANTNGGLGSGAITLQGGATINSLMGANNSLGIANAIIVPTGQTGNLVTPNRFSWGGTLSGGGTLNATVNTTVSRFDFNGNLTGFTGNLNLAGAGTARLFSNGGTFNGNSFQNLALDLAGTVNIGPVTNSGGNTYPIGALSGSVNTAGLGGGTAGSPTYQVGGLNTDTTFAGYITGNAILTKVGTGKLTLTNGNSYTGVTNINAGTLAINGQWALGGAVYAGTNFNGGTLQYTPAINGSNGTADISQDSVGGVKPVTIAAGGATIDTNGNDVTYAYAIGNSGTGGLTKAGLGTLTLSNALTNTGITTVKAGSLKLAPAAHSTALTAAGGVDIQGGKLLLDYTASTSPVSTVKSILDAEAAGAGFATGQIHSSTLTAGRTIGYGDNGTDTVTVRVTLAGDADLDGDVDFNDFLVLQSKFGQSNTRFDEANFNYDGFTDFNDFLALQANFGQSVGGDSVAFTSAQVAAMTAFASDPTNQAVPEPASLTLIGMGAAGLLGRRRRTK
ncbi:MAG: autotransporter-associated beta strand repeat-containing protein [Tepidisphaeraceae bacterium]